MDFERKNCERRYLALEGAYICDLNGHPPRKLKGYRSFIIGEFCLQYKRGLPAQAIAALINANSKKTDLKISLERTIVDNCPETFALSVIRMLDNSADRDRMIWLFKQRYYLSGNRYDYLKTSRQTLPDRTKFGRVLDNSHRIGIDPDNRFNY